MHSESHDSAHASNGSDLNALVLQHRTTGDETSASRVVEHMQPYVTSLARGYCFLSGRNIFYDDMISDGNLGIVRALSAYDDSKGDFEPYCKSRIRGEILDGVRERSPNIRRVEEHRRMIEKLEEENGKLSPDDYISHLQKNKASKELQRGFARNGFQRTTIIPIDTLVHGNNDGGDNVYLSDVLEELHVPLPSEHTCESELPSLIARDLQNFNGLLSRDKQVIVEYLNTGKVEDIAKRAGITSGRVCQIVKAALHTPGLFPLIREYLGIDLTKANFPKQEVGRNNLHFS